jgi:hypothetical protein
MIPGDIEKIGYETIERLVENKVSEDRTLEYKESLQLSSPEEKREFLYDVSSFANASGGDLIYGVREERDSAGKPTGIPEAIQPLNFQNASAEILRIESLIRDGIEPRILGFVPKPIEVPSGSGSILVLRIPQSWQSPHMVKFSGASKFYTRSSAGKFPMDVGQIRSAFNATSNLPSRLQNLRLERLAKIVAGETPVEAVDGPKLVLHLIPLSALESSLDITDDLSPQSLLMALHPIAGRSGSFYRYNFDGLVIFANDNPSINRGRYVQLYRSGLIEAVDSDTLGIDSPEQWRGWIPSTFLEQCLLQSCQSYLNFLKSSGITAPIFVLATLTGVKGLCLAGRDFRTNPIDRDTLFVPAVTLENLERPLHPQLRPICDAIWRSAGVSRSPNFDNQGNWHSPA